jgi:putative N6-adenine-specific DNA methylase
MCGSGTFILEAAEMARGLKPGRDRAFAFEKLQSFDPAAWAQLRLPESAVELPFRFIGFDRNAGAIEASKANAERAGIASLTSFAVQPVSGLMRPEGPPGLVITNPPYGKRIGDVKKLSALYATLGRVLCEGFAGWRVGVITDDRQLAEATALPFIKPTAPVLHGGLRVQLWRCDVLK